MEKSSDELIREYLTTCKIISDGFYMNDRMEEIELEKVKTLKTGSKLYSNLVRIPQENLPYFENTKVYVQNIDTFAKAIELGPNAACLNMASSFSAGGGVSHGSRAQEECLCRRSNLLLSLYAFTSLGDKVFHFSKDLSKGKYPLDLYDGIYSPCVNIFKKSDYSLMDEPRLTNVISVSAVSRPKLTEDGKIEDRFVSITKGKIRTILRIAILNGHSKLVLGAFGCGAYKNPAKHVAEIFRSVLSEDEFLYSFEEICFAILEDKNSKRIDNPDGNYKPFADVFGEK